MLFIYDTIQCERNINLTDPQGQTIATSLIAAACARASSLVEYDIKSSSRNAYFDDGNQKMFLPTAAPVSAVTVSKYNTVTSNYVAIDTACVRFSDNV
jgi:hypothetical protein